MNGQSPVNWERNELEPHARFLGLYPRSCAALAGGILRGLGVLPRAPIHGVKGDFA